MNHLLLTTDFRPRPGGIATYLDGIAASLAARGHEVRVVVWGLDRPDSFDPEYTIDYAEGTSRRPGRRLGDSFFVLRKLNSLFYIWRHRREVVRALERTLPSFRGKELRIYVGVWDIMAHWWCKWLRDRGVSYQLFAYGQEMLGTLGPLRRRWRADDFRSADTIFACSTPTASLVERRFGTTDTVVVHPGITEPESADEVQLRADDLRRELEIGSDRLVLVTVGRLVRRKGVHRVLEALASTDLRDKPVRYVVAGDGPEKTALMKLSRALKVADRVDFLGHVDDETKWAAYALGDVFVMPNSDVGGGDWEGFGIVFLEAAIMGLPAVGGRSGGAVEAVEHGETGILIEPGEGQVTNALVELLENAELRHRLGTEARNRARNEFSWREASRRVLAAGREVTSG